MARLGAFATLLLVIGLLGASSASAAYQQVGNFAGKPGEVHKVATEWPEEVQLGGLGGMAVNYTGAGGVPAGTVYAATYESSAGILRIARYNPDRSFSEAWVVNTKEQEEKFGKYERCGPEGEAAHPNCLARPSSGSGFIDVDVDQATGNVYTLYMRVNSPGNPAITEYSPDGSEVIARFGEQAADTETIAESPAKIHRSSAGGIAVNAAGEVYVFDYQFPIGNDKEQQRLMVFKPKVPGNYTEYEYAGLERDLGTGEDESPDQPVIDAAGDVFTTGAAREIEKYEPGKGASPVCSFSFKKGQITAMTVNPKTGEVFFYSYTDRKLHRLDPCDSEGNFSEAEALKIAPPRDTLGGMAVDPERSFGAGRPAGILYTGSGSESGAEIAGESAMGYIFAPPLDEVAPLVVAETVSAVTSSSARLEGTVNPRGTPSRYRFQYLSEAAYEANEPSERFAGALEVPLGGGLLEGSANLPVGDAVSGLSADTTYRYRILATSHCSSTEPEKECVGEGEARAFRTYPSEAFGLPDNRAWELVSPTQKNGGQVIPANPDVSSCLVECKPGAAYNMFPMQSAPDGNAISYEGYPFSFDEGALIENQYIAHRTATGWQSANPTPARLSSKGGGGYQAFKADLSEGVLEQINFPLSSLGPPEYGNLYTQPLAEPASLDPFLNEAPPNREPGNFNGLQLSFAGASADFSRFFFSANDALTPEAEGGSEAKTNLYERSGGELHLVNFAPGDATTIPNASFGGKSTFHAISQDGSRAFWSSESGQLYVRIDGEETQEAADHTGRFLTASADGSKALLDDGCLYVVEAKACEDLTQGEGGFEGVVGQSEDLSRIYFIDTKVLSGEEENEHGDKAQAGKFNLYAWDEGETAFIATLLASDNANALPLGDWAVSPQRRSAAASPDGSWLTFLSKAPLSGFDNTGPCEYVDNPGIFVNAPCKEVFLYQAQTGELRCASCNRTGAPPRGPSHVLQLKRDNLPLPRYLSDSGRLFFDSQDSLSPFDTNGRVEDVYEFEPAGVGSCGSEAGCVRLISAGRSGVDSNFFAADPSGKNVFFTSRDKLVGADKDDLIDLYDAREGGGFPPDPGPAECQGEACLPSVSPPNDPTPASAGFKGPGNQGAGEPSGRCPKGRHAVKRKGKPRCVKSAAKRQHHKRHNNRGGAK